MDIIRKSDAACNFKKLHPNKFGNDTDKQYGADVERVTLQTILLLSVSLSQLYRLMSAFREASVSCYALWCTAGALMTPVWNAEDEANYCISETSSKVCRRKECRGRYSALWIFMSLSPCMPHAWTVYC